MAQPLLPAVLLLRCRCGIPALNRHKALVTVKAATRRLQLVERFLLSRHLPFLKPVLEVQGRKRRIGD